MLDEVKNFYCEFSNHELRLVLTTGRDVIGDFARCRTFSFAEGSGGISGLLPKRKNDN